MIVETTDLKTVANYAKKKRFSLAWAYRLVAENKIKSIKIDGVKFIFVNQE